jgi:hypothetical protein
MDYNDWEYALMQADPRRCPHHPHEITSSSDGMFDVPCNACEGEAAEYNEWWDQNEDNPYRTQCRSYWEYNPVAYISWIVGDVPVRCEPTEEDNIPF